MRAPAVPKQPIGTKGFSLVFRINFSLKVSSLTLGRGLKPSIIGGRSKSKGMEEESEDSPFCSGAAGTEDAAIADVNCRISVASSAPGTRSACVDIFTTSIFFFI